jgi:hypothetical protein
MKRKRYAELESFEGLYPIHNSTILSINKIETQIDATIKRNSRFLATKSAEPSVVKKVLRIFIHHKFISQTDFEKSHFLLILEGYILDAQLIRKTKLGRFFDKLRIQIDRKQLNDRQIEWTRQSEPNGSEADCFRIKVYSEKVTQIRIILQRSTDTQMRFEISPTLRNILTGLPIDPYEEEVLILTRPTFNVLSHKYCRQVFLAVWELLMQRGLLIEGREKKMVKSDEV